jgi:AmmeMemoRadiSam system protein A
VTTHLPDVARAAIAARLAGRRAARPEPVGRPGAVFVTLKIEGVLRGCIGTLEAQHSDLADETADRALGAAFHDPRFPPLTSAELDRCSIDVTVIGPLETVESEAELDPARWGVEVSDGQRRGVLLPALEGIDTVESQLRLVRQKAGIPPDTPIRIRRFTAEKLEDRS